MEFNYQRPRRLEVEELTENFGRFVAEPFERGYGNTIGIALRRVMLSLIEGYAITAVRIDGVLHEFSMIPGVYEDVLNIILNLKGVPLKLNVDEPRIVRIEKSGGGEIVSGDFVTDSDVEVLDSDIHIAYLEEGAEFRAEILVRKGVGFHLAEQNYDENLPVDYIPVDSNFNPVEKVKFTISPARVGKRTDYEKLTLEVWTNGSISPKNALAHAGKILRDHLAIFLDAADETGRGTAAEPETSVVIEKKTDVLEKNVESMGLSVRALKCLKRLGVDYIYQLVEKTEHELLNSKNFGKKSLEEILIKLDENGLALGQKLPESMKVDLDDRLNTSPVREDDGDAEE